MSISLFLGATCATGNIPAKKTLPTVIIKQCICSFLTGEDLARISEVNKAGRDFVSDPILKNRVQNAEAMANLSTRRVFFTAVARSFPGEEIY